MRGRTSIAFACLAALVLSGCTAATQAVTGGPVVVADQTKLDEQVGLSLTLAYTAAAKAAALAITLADASGHPLSSATVQKIGQLDQRAFAAVTAVRAAYLAGNGSNYLSAISGARAAVNDILAAIGGGTSMVLPGGSYRHAAMDARAAHLGLARAVQVQS
jgi:hypothetical protein